MTLNTRKPTWPIAITDTGCHEWQAARMSNGYGTLTIEGHTEIAHRVAYERAYGAIPEGLHIDHICRNRPCVNPDHLEAVTQAENNKRAADAQELCINGHPRTTDNLIVDSVGYRRCRTCRSEDRARAQRRYKEKNRARINAAQRQYRASRQGASA